MYTNIPPKEAFTICSSLLKTIDLEGASLKSICSLLRFVLQNNFFQYEGTTYHQVSGLAMGTSCAPVIANLYCAVKEVELRKRYPQYYYGRYIDDIFTTFKGTEEALQAYLETIQLGPLKITWEYSMTSMHFLDVLVYAREGRLATCIYRKELNKYLYIPFSSAHPIAVKKAFIKAERSRIRSICSEEDDNSAAQRFLFLNLLRRGYPQNLLNKLFSLPLSPREKEEKENRILFPSSYNPIWEYINVSTISTDFQDSAREVGLTLPTCLTGNFLLSLKRTRNFYDLFNGTNKSILEDEVTSAL
jgi:hypothetical protein